MNTFQEPQQIDPSTDLMAGGAPISAAQRQELMDMLNKLKAQMKTVEASKFALNNKTENNRKTLLRQVFEKLRLAGVDLSNRESVAAFIMELQKNNPELAASFEKAMDKLLGKGSVDEQDINNMNNINNNETFSQGQ